MSKLFSLKILTPEREFFEGEVEAVNLNAPDGKVEILANHTPFIMPVDVGTLSIKQNGEWIEAVNSEGFIEVRRHDVVIFVQTCERPDEIDVRRAEEARRHAEEVMRQKQSMTEYQQSKLALARAMARLKLSGPGRH